MSSEKTGVRQDASRRASGPAGFYGPNPVYVVQPVRLSEFSEENIVLLFMELPKWVPVVGFAISFYSAIFATFILYPWHIEISRELINMREMCDI
jgi:hypothetical protein